MTPAHPLQSLRAAATSDAGRPCVIWYGDEGRIELSAASLWNYAVKAANLFTQECDLPMGSPVRLQLPAHWQSVGLILGVWLAGAAVTYADAPALVVAHDGDADAMKADVITSLDAWGRASENLSTATVLDIGRDLRAQSDVLIDLRPVDMNVTAVISAREPDTFTDLLAQASELPKTVGVVAQPQSHVLPTELPTIAAHVAAGGCVVICAEQMTDDVARQEQVALWM
ncbi:MAG: hypothetical protein EBU85_01195 [Actinobacteria bacterium]|nr:hypothetical protein [Actinomycetota bacterium]